MGISFLISLFAGGYVTARLAGSLQRVNGILHGLVVWGIVSLASVYLMTTAAGSLLGGAFTVAGKGISMLGTGAAIMAPQVVSKAAGQGGLSLDSIIAEGKQAISQSGKPAAPGTIQASDKELTDSLKKLFAGGTVNAADKDATVNALVARTNLTRPEAEAKVDGWISQYQQTKAQTETTARNVSQDVMSGLSKAAMWAFIAMVLEAVAAGIGGALGARTEYRHARHA
jgi:hypothetical protein